MTYKENDIFEENGKNYKLKVIPKYEKKGDKTYFIGFEKVFEEIKPFWGDNWRNTHPVNPTEKAPSFRTC